ncbi:MAG: peptide-methionine (S)-S-oxide reductase MsrA [Bacteroidota bacterium]|jgi:peptide-methionine (S)-S-oxide reductase
MKYILKSLIALNLLIITALTSCSQTPKTLAKMNTESIPKGIHTDTATFGEGCFWCTEAYFQRLKGVYKVMSGYGGGHVVNPSYEEVCDKKTGHVELCQIIYDPKQITYDELLEVFWKTHDPTTMDRQGNDEGPQYRSVIFYKTETEKAKALQYKMELDKSGSWPRPIVTTIEPFKNFYPAENYHQNYYNDNQNQGYCRFVIQPKLEKFEKVFKNKLKPH